MDRQDIRSYFYCFNVVIIVTLLNFLRSCFFFDILLSSL